MTTPIVMAKYLASRTAVIAGLEGAGECFGQIRDLIDKIDGCINRPYPPKYCGACPTLDEDQNRCAEPIYAKHDEIETTCWRCKQTFNVEALIQAGLANSHGLNYTVAEIVDLMDKMGTPVSDRVLRSWRACGKLVPRSEWGADEPRFWLNDVVRLRNKENAA